MELFKFGVTASGLPILANRLGRSGPKVLVLGGVHGNEPEGVAAAYGLIDRFMNGFPYGLQMTIVPAFNQDGVLALNRLNARGVDLNRNLPTKDWRPEAALPKYNPGPEPCSEPENKALVEWIEKEKPRFIISLHSYEPCLNINGDCRDVAEVIQSMTGYQIVEDIGYPTPGCLGTYTGHERGIPTITYEIERGLDKKRVVELHVPALLEAFKKLEEKL